MLSRTAAVGGHLVDVQSYTKVAGLPFKAEELQHVFTDIIDQEAR